MLHHWRDSLRLGADLALLGIVVTVLSLPVLTAGTAVATGSAAIHHLINEGRWPSLVDCWAEFRRRLVPGLVAGPAVAAAVALVVLDVTALRRGAVPGGAPALAAVLTAVALGAGWLALVVFRAGAAPSKAVRSALTVAVARPAAPAAAAGVLVVAGVLTLLIHPALVPVLAGYVLFALHVVLPRLTTPKVARWRTRRGAPAARPMPRLAPWSVTDSWSPGPRRP